MMFPSRSPLVLGRRPASRAGALFFFLLLLVTSLGRDVQEVILSLLNNCNSLRRNSLPPELSCGLLLKIEYFAGGHAPRHLTLPLVCVAVLPRLYYYLLLLKHDNRRLGLGLLERI